MRLVSPKTPRYMSLNKTKIEWTDYSVNPIKGLCKHNCSVKVGNAVIHYCYARGLYERFRWDPNISFQPDELKKIDNLKKPSKIFMCSTHDIMGNWIPDEWIETIVDCCTRNKQHIFQLLSKNPSRYPDFIFPNNVWLGTSVESQEHFQRIQDLINAYAKIKFVSFEPLVGDMKYLVQEENLKDVDWFIIGRMTGKKAIPPLLTWVSQIVEAATELKIPVFIKDNIRDFFPNYKYNSFRQYPHQTRCFGKAKPSARCFGKAKPSAIKQYLEI